MAPHLLRDQINKRRFKRAKAKADHSGEMLCAVAGKNGKPIYFTASRTTPEPEVEARAFALRNRRDITQGERMLQSASRAKTVRGAPA